MKRGFLKTILCIIFLITMLAACTSEKENDMLSKKDASKSIEKREKGQAEKDETKTMEKENEKIKKERETKDNLYQVNQETWAVQPLEKGVAEEVVLLTIDDAPDQYALEMATILKENNASAIFFVNGHFLETEKEKKTLKEIYDMGFVIGNHTYSHAYLPDLQESEQKEEILRVNEMVEEITGEKPSFFRAPHGANTEFSHQLVKQEKMVQMNWSYGYDFQQAYMEKEALVKIMLQTELLGNGANLLMHDREWTKDALKEIVLGLRDQGYNIVDPKLIQVP